MADRRKHGGQTLTRLENSSLAPNDDGTLPPNDSLKKCRQRWSAPRLRPPSPSFVDGVMLAVRLARASEKLKEPNRKGKGNAMILPVERFHVDRRRCLRCLGAITTRSCRWKSFGIRRALMMGEPVCCSSSKSCPRRHEANASVVTVGILGVKLI